MPRLQQIRKTQQTQRLLEQRVTQTSLHELRYLQQFQKMRMLRQRLDVLAVIFRNFQSLLSKRLARYGELG